LDGGAHAGSQTSPKRQLEPLSSSIGEAVLGEKTPCATAQHRYFFAEFANFGRN
jgi:hypothetical protein